MPCVYLPGPAPAVTVANNYHVDRCTKNKRMFLIPMRGLFLTCSESSFLVCTHKQIPSGCVFTYLKKKERKRNTLTWKGGPLFMVANSHPLRSLAWSQLSCTPCSSITPPCPTPTPASHKKDIYLHADDINMPATSVRHSNKMLAKRVKNI